MIDAEIRVQLADLARQIDDDPEAGLSAAEALLADPRWTGPPDRRARVEAEAGIALRRLARHPEAIARLERAAALARDAGDTAFAAEARLGQIDSLGVIGQTDDALRLATNLETEFRRQGRPDLAARALVNAANLHLRRDRFALALATFERAREAIQASGDPDAVARLDANTATTLMEVGHFDEAEQQFGRARAGFEAAGASLLVAMVEANLGYLQFRTGRLGEAVATLTRARDRFAQEGRSFETAKCDADRGDIFRALNLRAEAAADYSQALPALVNAGMNYEEARVRAGRAAVAAADGRFAEAMTDLATAEALFRRQRNAVQTAQIRLIRGHILRRRGDEEEAMRQWSLALRSFVHHGSLGWAAECRFALAVSSQLPPSGSIRRLTRALTEARAYRRGALEAEILQALARRTRSARAALARARAAGEALESARAQVAPESWHTAFLEDKLSVYETLVRLLLARGRPADLEEALTWMERAKSRLLLERILAAREQGDAPHNHELERLRGQLSQLYQQLPGLAEGERRVATPEELSLAETAYETALREAERRHQVPSLATQGFAVVPLAEIQRRLTGQRLVEYFVLDSQVGAFLVSDTRIEVVRNLASLDDVTRASRRLRFLFQSFARRAGDGGSGRTSGALSQLRELYDLLLRPLEGSLDTGRVLVVPHGPLHGLPFHAFQRSDDEFALDRWEFAQAPSASIWQANVNRKASGRGALIVGVSAPGLETLISETEAVADALAGLPGGVHRLTDQAATREAVRRGSGAQRYVHLATHGLFRGDNPLFSGVRLADGWLLARDLYDRTIDADLVTLSACQTAMVAVAPGDELFGLVRGFLAAGARAVCASLWPADDRSTTALMAAFYRGLNQSLPLAGALRHAQRTVRHRWSDPYYWAPFTLIGPHE